MKEKGVTSKALAEKTGLKQNSINEYRSARRKEPSLSRGLLIAGALGVDPWELLQVKKTEL